jgi:hypothetical protein
MKYALLILLCLPALFLPGQPADPYPPTRTPDRVTLTWSDDPATTQSVTWRTDVSIKEAFAEIAPANASPDFREQTDTIPATTELLITNNNAAHFHSATFTGLEPETKYVYRVGQGDYWSEWFHFDTASDKDRPFSFIYFGDAQNELKSMWSRCIREAYSTMPDVDFMIHAGDLINSANNDLEWGEWHYAGGWIYGMVPSIATPGNHEYAPISGNRKGRELSKHWRPSFTFPTNGPNVLSETVYYVDYQGVRFISLDTPAMYADSMTIDLQRGWLEETLQNNPNRWTIVTHHHPIYSTALGRDNPELREALQPIYERYGVDLVLQGHDHTYGRGYNLKFGEKHVDRGPIYVVSVSGPKMYQLSFEEWLERGASNTQLYQIISVDGKRLEYKAYTATGELYDAFELVKRRSGMNDFIDQAPLNVPEIADIPVRYLKKMTEEEIKLYQKHFEAYKMRKAMKE